MDFADAIITDDIRDSRDARAILACRRTTDERDVTASTYRHGWKVSNEFGSLSRTRNRPTALEVCLDVNTLVSSESPATGTGGSTGGKPNVTRHPLLPQRICAPLREIAWAAREVATLPITDTLGELALTIASLRAKSVRADEIASIVRSALTNSIVRVIACFPNLSLSWTVS